MNDQRGMPAYPSGESYTTTDLAGNRTECGKGPLHRGVGMRTYIATRALAGLLAQTTHTESGYSAPAYETDDDMTYAARRAVIAADALLEELMKPTRPPK